MAATGDTLLPLLLSRRQALDGCVPCFSELIYSALYRRFKTEPLRKSSATYQGSIFNIQFSPSDSIVLTACSNKAIIGYDPRISTSKLIRSVPNAHCDCTNCITFIDEATFASCSDDKTIRLWDLRNLSACISTLTGHTNWIKNIEYDRKSNKLFSVAFHDGVREWDLGNYKSGTYEESSNHTFKLKDPVRMRIAPDGSKMFVSLRQNRCCVIDRFDGETVAEQRKTVEKLVDNSPISSICDLDTNRPRIYTMSGLRGTKKSFRSVMSVVFHPSSEMVALRHVDVKNNNFERELSTLYDLRLSESEFQPHFTIENSSTNYLKYIDEYSPDHSLDYIKECGFSADGRVLASPYNEGVRLLAVDSKCTPADVYYDDRYLGATRGHDFEVASSLFGHPSPVLCCGFAHHDLILGSGCMEGQILFHKPQL